MHCLTVDLEDWFHFLDIDENIDVAGWDSYETYVVSMTTELLSFFDAYDQKATFFVLGWVADRFPELIRDVLWHGHEIACHSYGHPLVYGLSPTDFERDLVKALDKIEAACGLRPTAYRAPGFSITADCLWAFDILRKNGIVTDSSIFPANRAHGGFDGAPVRPFIIETAYGDIVELPISCVNFMGIK